MYKNIENIHDYYVGISTGRSTGVALWNTHEKRFVAVKTLPIHRAIEYVSSLIREGYDIQVRFVLDDSRDVEIWRDFCIWYKISHLPISRMPEYDPKKIREEISLTWKHCTTRASRCAANIVYGV